MSKSRPGMNAASLFEYSVSDADKAKLAQLARVLKVKEANDAALRAFQSEADKRIEEAKRACAERSKKRESQNDARTDPSPLPQCQPRHHRPQP